MTDDPRDDLDLRSLRELPLITPRAGRNQRVRSRCHEVLARRRWLSAVTAQVLGVVRDQRTRRRPHPAAVPQE